MDISETPVMDFFYYSYFAALHPATLLKRIPLGIWLGVGMQPCYKASDDLRIENRRNRQ